MIIKIPALNTSELTAMEELKKIESEFNEVKEAFFKPDIDNLISEVLDLQQTCTTMLDILGAEEKDINRHYYKLKSYEAQGKYKLKGHFEIKFIPYEEDVL